MGGVPSVPQDRSRRIQVIAAGYSRTGTTSISIALARLLDGPVFHGGNQIFQREDAWMREWCRMIDADGRDPPAMLARLRRITAGYAAIADAPAYLLLPELLALYPDAKVVLVTRDRARWYRSMAPIMRSVAVPMRLLAVLLWPCPTWRWLPGYLVWAGKREEKRIGLEFSPDMLDKHNDWVRRNVPPGRFFEMDLAEGWQPLADFLGVPAPPDGVPFPRANDAAEAHAVTRRVLRTAALAWAGILAAAAAAAWQAHRLWTAR
ncbi:NAD dependent epimerase [Cordyceps militaris]|uniref:NAD dependent epimerase n=1 Tax=Cordyceps militaris TaxID=73501 RepID=A0A2H4S6H9_CORMI|nr:NAD dependent epimerase [Cordyceps militaris]